MRHAFSAALTYELPVAHQNSLVKGLTSGWALDSLFRVNSSVPVNVTTGVLPAFGLWWNADAGNQRPNIVSGQPFYLHDAAYPGGMRINPAALSTDANRLPWE
jgi:hypothetical protein